MVNKRTCSCCRETKPASDFGVDKHKTSGYRSSCKLCAAEKAKTYRQINPHNNKTACRKWWDKNKDERNSRQSASRDAIRPKLREYAKRKYYENQEASKARGRASYKNNRPLKYGISIEQYDAMFKQQGGVCALCGKQNSAGRSLAIDHCHKTGVVRGLLCGKCNVGLGVLGDCSDRLMDAVRYLWKTESN